LRGGDPEHGRRRHSVFPRMREGSSPLKSANSASEVLLRQFQLILRAEEAGSARGCLTNALPPSCSSALAGNRHRPFQVQNNS
jgi:hypothetical protein